MQFYITPVVKILSVAIFLIHIFQYIFAVDLTPFLGMKYGVLSHIHIYKYFSYALLHASFPHMIGSLLALITIGSSLEKYMGSLKFIFFLIACIFGAAVMYQVVEYVYMKRFYEEYVQYLSNPSPSRLEFMLSRCPEVIYTKFYSFLRDFSFNPEDRQLIDTSVYIAEGLYSLRSAETVIGLSSVTFGLLIAFALLFPNFSMMILPIPIPIKSKYLAVGYMIYEIYKMYSATSWSMAPHIMNVGGALFGSLYIYFFVQKDRFW